MSLGWRSQTQAVLQETIPHDCSNAESKRKRSWKFLESNPIQAWPWRHTWPLAGPRWQGGWSGQQLMWRSNHHLGNARSSVSINVSRHQNLCGKWKSKTNFVRNKKEKKNFMQMRRLQISPERPIISHELKTRHIERLTIAGTKISLSLFF